MLWLLIALLLLLCLAALAVACLTLWRRVKALGRQVGQVGETAALAQQQIKDAQAGGPLELTPCPTCGTRVLARQLRPTG